MSKAQFDQYYKIKVIPTRLRVFNFMKIWVDKHFEDFADEGPLEERLLLFVTERRTHHYYQGATMNAAAAQLKKFYEKKARLQYFKRAFFSLINSYAEAELFPVNIGPTHDEQRPFVAVSVDAYHAGMLPKKIPIFFLFYLSDC